MLESFENAHNGHGDIRPLRGPSENSGSSPGSAAQLRIRAELYRLLAEILYDPSMAAIAQDCARDLEIEATSREQKESRDLAKLA
jgi:hypothetical protein